MIVTQITDCKDSNALGRSESRIASLFNCAVVSVGVNDNLDGIGSIEAGGNLIEVLDAIEDREAVVLVNAAPRQGEAKKWENGTPFCWFQYKNVKVISSIQGNALSFVKKLQLIEKVNLIDIPNVLPFALKNRLIDDELAKRIRNTQFRSFDYLPRIAFWLYRGLQVPSVDFHLSNVGDVESLFWWIDNFGNCKTSILNNEIKSEFVETNFGKLKIYNRLKDVPNNEVAFVTGSSGIGENRFLELIIQGKSAALELNIKSGDKIELRVKS